MSDESLDVREENGVHIVTFAPRTVLDIATSEALGQELLALASAPPPPRILIDFTAVRFLASRMLGILVELTRKAEAGSGMVVVCGLHGDLSDVFRVTRLNRLLRLVEGRQEAMTFLAAAGES